MGMKLYTDQLEQTINCPFCEDGKAHLTVLENHIQYKDKMYPSIKYICNICQEGFTTNESDSITMANIQGFKIVQPEGYEGMTKLPWHISEKGFSMKDTVPTIYATNDDLEIIVKINKDRVLAHSVQNNIMNAKYIHMACNEYPSLVQRVKELEAELEKLKTINE